MTSGFESWNFPAPPVRKYRRLIVVLPYTPERVAKIKTVLGRRWHAPAKHWTVPRSDEMRSRLLDLFAGDAVELDPSLDGHSVPPPPAQTGEDAVIARLHEAVKARHLSPRTAEAYSERRLIGRLDGFLDLFAERVELCLLVGVAAGVVGEVLEV